MWVTNRSLRVAVDAVLECICTNDSSLAMIHVSLMPGFPLEARERECVCVCVCVCVCSCLSVFVCLVRWA